MFNLIGDVVLPERYYETRSDPINFMSAWPTARKNRGFRGLYGNESDLLVMAT